MKSVTRRLARALRVAVLLLMLPVCRAAGAEGRSQALCYTTYDQDYFYVAVTVKKPNLAGTQTAPFSDARADDAVGVYLQSEDGPTGPRRGARSVEMVVSAAGGAQLYRGANATPLKGFEDFRTTPEGGRVPFKYGVTRRGALNQPGGNDTGYTVEMAIPWIELGGPPQVGQRWRFNVVCYSAAPGSSPILSLAPEVKTLADAQDPSLWGEIVFVDAPVKSVASAPNAKVSARVFAVRPLIDGTLTPGEWNTLTAFGFEEGEAGSVAVPVAPAAGAGRVRPQVTLHKARPPLIPPALPGAESGEGVIPRTPQPLPRLVFTLYHYDFQNDPRKAAPLLSVRREDGVSLLATHPMDGCGPWMTYDRVDWHRAQLEEMRKAGIDVVLPVYRAGGADKQRYAQRGLITLAGALRWLRTMERDYPMVGLYLDTASLSDARGGRLDLRGPQGQARLYAAIKEFFLQIPHPFRAAIPLSEKNGGGTANIVVLSSGAAFADMDPSFVDYLRRRFAAEFGSDLLILGGSDFKPKAKLDGYVNDTRGRGFQMDGDGWIKAAGVGVGYDRTVGGPVRIAGVLPVALPGKDGQAAPRLRSREDGETYRREWKQALEKRADWVFADGWNDYLEGTEIAPTQERGLQYADLTRVFSRALAGSGPMRAAFIAHTLPHAAPLGAACRVSVRVLNAGNAAWTTDTYALSYRWLRADGTEAGTLRLIPLPGTILPGQAFSVPILLPVPQQAGAYRLIVDVAQVGKRGDVTALFSSLGSAPLDVPIRIVPPNDPALPAYAASLVSTDLPTTLEAGGTYTAKVTLRNDGAETWKRAGGGRIAARVWRYISAINGTGEKEQAEPVEMADASAELPHDVAPGQEVTVSVPLTFSQPDGTPLPAWSQADHWTYLLRWEFSANEAGAQGAVTGPEPLALVEADFGVQFINDLSPRQMPGERRIPVKIGLRNMGPQTWRKEATRIGYHWYYLDGTEVVWEDETTPLPQDVPPGGEIPEMLVWINPPPNDGTYWLVWDVKIGDTWASTLPSARPYETLVHQIEVVRGRLTFVDLRKVYNLDGIAGDADRADGDFDGTGRTLPAELVPPFANSDTAPSTLWLPMRGAGVDSPRRISFRWGPKGDGEKNVVQCAGQRVPVAVDMRKAEVYKTVHLLAAATKEDTSGAFTLIFADGSEQFTSFPFSRWDGPPTLGEEVSYICRYSRTRAGDATDRPVALFRYAIPISEPKKLAAIVLPNQPALKIVAITLEK